MDKKQKQAKKVKYSNARKALASAAAAGGSSSVIKLPDGLEFYKFQEGRNVIDVLSFDTGDSNYNVREPGVQHFEKTYFVHTGVGPDDRKAVCAAKTYSEPCPICEYAQRRQRAGTLDEETRKALLPKQRQVFCFHDVPNKKLKIYEGSFYRGFGELLDTKLQGVDEDHEYNSFARNDEEGMRLIVLAKTEKLPNGSFIQPKSIEMEHRKRPLDPDLIAQVPCLDDLVKKPDYDELKKAFEMKKLDTEEEEEEDDAPPAKAGKAAGKKAAVPDDDDDSDDDDDETLDEEEDDAGADPTAEELGVEVGDTVTHKKLGECRVVHVSPDGTSLRLKDRKGNEHRAIAPKDVEKADDEEDEEDEDDAPKAKAGKKPVNSAPDDDEEEEEEDEDDSEPEEEDESDDEEEEEPEPPKKRGRGRPPGSKNKPKDDGAKAGKAKKKPADDDDDVF